MQDFDVDALLDQVRRLLRVFGPVAVQHTFLLTDALNG